MELSFSGSRVTVMGLGRFGAGVGVTRFLSNAGATVTVTDLRPASQLTDSLAAIADLPNVRLQLGRHDESDFVSADVVVASPAVRPDNQFLQLATGAGAKVTSEIRLFWDRCPAPIVGVTGSNGKSTTATLIHDVLAAAGHQVWLGGNIGRSLLGDIKRIKPSDWVVLELSSFQLASLDVDRRSPHVAIVTNLAPNHLDWHGSLRTYFDAKQTIVRWQSVADLAVRFDGTSEARWPVKGQSIWCGRHISCDAWLSGDRTAVRVCFKDDSATVDLSDCPALNTPHQHNSALLASAAGFVLGVAPQQIQTALGQFRGLPHRLQMVAEVEARRVINDSASTTPESTIAALEAVHTPIVLIVGGNEKGCLLDPLARAIVEYARVVIMFGGVSATLADRVSSILSKPSAHDGEPSLETITCVDSLESAVMTARQYSRSGETILFSPGFTSGAMFYNFADRGDQFVELVKASASRSATSNSDENPHPDTRR